MISPNLSLVLTFVVTLAISLTIFFVPKAIISRSKKHQAIQIVLVRMLRGPVLLGIAGYGLIRGIESLLNLTAPGIPFFFRPDGLLMILELAIIAVFVQTLGSVVKQILPSLIGAKEVDQILVYLVYSLGLVAFGYVILTSPISPGVATNIWAVINFMTGIFLTYLAVYIVNIVSKKYTLAIENKEASLRTTISFARRLGLSLVALVGVSTTTFASFPAAGVAIASLFIAAGFASIVIGLAAQTSLSNLVAGMVISTSQPFKIGEAVLFANEWCWVEDVKLTFTVLKTWDNRRLMVPNQLFLTNTIVNYDASDSTKLCIVFVTITYESDMDKAIGVLKEVAKHHPDFLPIGNLPVVHVMDFTESGINLRLLSRAKDQPTNFQMSKDILYKVKKVFDSNGIVLAYPRRQILITDPLSKDSSMRGGMRTPSSLAEDEEENQTYAERSQAEENWRGESTMVEDKRMLMKHDTLDVSGKS